MADEDQSEHEVTRILEAIQEGEAQAADRLLPIVYDELRRLAAQKLFREKPGQTLQATALVHEAYLRLVGEGDPGWENRGHFFAAAAEAMRRILVDRARQKRSLRHGGSHERVDIELDSLPDDGPLGDVTAIDRALDELAADSSPEARLFTLRYFGGLTNEEAARVLCVSPRTANRYWRYACTWILRELHDHQA
jgi:RNA polymerase sigma factor (TIGR02999 family)